MREIIEIELEDIIPDIEEVLKAQGMPARVEPGPRIVETFEQAVEVFKDLADPTAIVEDISKNEFGDVYEGEGENAEEDPVAIIYPKAEYLALFALTVGKEVSEQIGEFFENNEYALGVMLDTIASEATERAGLLLELDYFERLEDEGIPPDEWAILRYSPGYCGWDISGQGQLFEYLRPEEIGIALNDSYLMEPLKSISGVMIVGPRHIHLFDMDFPFCDNCTSKSCRERIRSIMNKAS